MSLEDDKSSIPVYLLKTRSLPSDGYEDLLQQNPNEYKYAPHFVPVLEHKFIHEQLAILRTSIQAGDFGPRRGGVRECRYGGLIFTSQRAVEAFTRVISDLRHEGLNIDEMLPASVPLYVVGPATARSLEHIGLQCQIVGEESGNGADLAQFILQHYNKSRTGSDSKTVHNPALLFLVGEQRRDIIPKTLQDQSLPGGDRIVVEEWVVYESGEMESFRKNFQQIIADTKPHERSPWVVVFSPTGCKAMLQVLGILDDDIGKATAIREEKCRKALVACIGPTTRDYLVREFDFAPDACALRPSPEGVLSAIETYTKSHRLD